MAVSTVTMVVLGGVCASALPNFLIILADDVGSGDYGLACGTDNKTACPITPNIDAMASSTNSIVFSRFYAGAGVCSPTRASVLTGRNNYRSCVKSAISCDHMNPAWECSMGPDMTRNVFSIAHAVKRRSDTYMTQHIGKWHLGDFYNKKHPELTEGFTNPSHAGFDEWFSTQAQTSTSVPNCGCFPPQNWQPPNPAPDFPYPPPKEFPHTFPGSNCIVGGGIYVNESFNCANYWFPSGNGSEGALGHVTNYTIKIVGDDGEVIVDRFDDFVQRATSAGKPFLSTIWMHYIHLPHPAMPSFFETAVPSGDPDYIGALAQWDVTMGRVKNVLSKYGVANDTLIWITSDNGPHCTESPYGCSGPLGKGRSNGGLRGCKASIFEGGIRVPGIIQWPAMINGNRKTQVPAVTHDILPTIMDILGVSSAHPDWALDGVSLKPFLVGTVEQMPKSRQTPIGFWWGDSQAWIDNDMKLIASNGTVDVGQGCVNEAPWQNGVKSPLLFNLSQSSTESIDVQLTQNEMFKSMKAQFMTWKASVQNSMATESMCGQPPPPPPTPPAPPGPPPPSNCTFIQGMIGYGGDGWQKNARTKEDCCSLCLADNTCTIAVWIDGVCRGKTPESKPGRPSVSTSWACRARQPSLVVEI
eukprot:m.225944 g.225944  ORF g.225944 m.225944 type:complete len:641 (-) comp33473_c0_seq1:242-2164(-)